MVENWVPIQEHGDYSVSDHGKVRSDRFRRYVALRRNQSGNIYVGLTTDGVQRNVGVARLVMTAFLDNPFVDSEFHVTPLHKDGDLSNNYASNLAPRPRWYAIEYQMQFPNPKASWYGRVIELDSGLIFNNSLEAAVHFGIIDLHIMTSILHEDATPVVPYHFRRYNQN